MLRHIWFLLATVFSAVIAVVAYPWLPTAIDAVTPGVLSQDFVLLFRQDPFTLIAGYVSIAALALFVLVFVGLAGLDGIRIQIARRKLTQLRDDAARTEDVPVRERFLAAFSDSPQFTRLAERYAASIDGHDAGSSEGRRAGSRELWSTMPATAVFNAWSLGERHLYLWFFAVLPLALAGLGVLSLVVSLLFGPTITAGAATAIGETGAAIPVSALPGLICLALTWTAALIIAVVMRAVLALRRDQARDLADIVDSLFHGGAEIRYLADVAQATRGTARDITASISKLGNKLHQDMVTYGQRMLEASQAHADVMLEKLSEAIEAALSKPLAKLTTATQQQTRNQNTRVKKLLDSVLVDFTKELEKHFGGQVKEVEALLKASAKTAGNVEKSFRDAVQALAKQSQAHGQALADQIASSLKQVKTDESERYAALAQDLRDFTQALRDQVETHSQRFEELLENQLSKTEELASSVLNKGAADIARTAASFEALQGSLESMITLITPIMRQVIENQESLLSAVEAESSASKVIGRASSELSAAAQASRETVERFIALAERLREIGATMNVRSGTAGARSERSSRLTVPARTEKLTQAVRELKNVARETSEALPKLDE